VDTSYSRPLLVSPLVQQSQLKARARGESGCRGCFGAESFRRGHRTAGGFSFEASGQDKYMALGDYARFARRLRIWECCPTGLPGYVLRGAIRTLTMSFEKTVGAPGRIPTKPGLTQAPQMVGKRRRAGKLKGAVRVWGANRGAFRHAEFVGPRHTSSC